MYHHFLPALLVIVGVVGGCALPRIQVYQGLTSVPALHADHILTEDGMRLPLAVWPAVGAPRGVVLALHGFNDYRRAFDATGAYLAGLGYTVYAFDQRGFGETAGAGGWFGEARLAADVRLAASLIRARHPDLPLYLLGESMGAAVAVLALAAHPGNWADGLILLAPAVWGRQSMPWPQRAALWLLAHTFPTRTLSARGLDIRATDNDAAIQKLREDPRVIKDTRVEALWGLVDLMDQALATPPPVWLPTLILYGARDQIIPKRPTCRWLAARPQSPRHRLAVYKEGWHLLTRDLQAETVLADIAVWLQDHSAPLPSGSEIQTRLPAFCPPSDGREGVTVVS